MKITCIKCGETLREPGGLLFSPPTDNKCDKAHLCKRCWAMLVSWIKGVGSNVTKP